MGLLALRPFFNDTASSNFVFKLLQMQTIAATHSRQLIVSQG